MFLPLPAEGPLFCSHTLTSVCFVSLSWNTGCCFTSMAAHKSSCFILEAYVCYVMLCLFVCLFTNTDTVSKQTLSVHWPQAIKWQHFSVFPHTFRFLNCLVSEGETHFTWLVFRLSPQLYFTRATRGLVCYNLILILSCSHRVQSSHSFKSQPAVEFVKKNTCAAGNILW